ncbi:MAG: prepilin-type N-terminal cleavage/methylation domain-containing protein [Acidobacteriota bacterium]
MQTCRRFCFLRSGFTLVEILVAVVVLAVVGTLVTSFTVTETWLYAKNTALNSSHRSARRALDRLANELQQTQNLPSLIDATGSATTATTAAGLSYDRLVGAPYKVDHPGGLGYSATDTKVSVTLSTNYLASPPVPLPGDVLLIVLPTGNPLRAQVSSVQVTKTDKKKEQQTMDLDLTNPLGTDVTWDPTQTKTAQLVRRQAFIVIPSGARNELRYYQSFEPMPALDDSTQYIVITDEVSTVKLPDGTRRDVTPFSIDTTGGDKLVKASLRMQAKDYVNSLATKQANSFNTFVQIDVTLPSRLRPKS